MTSHHQDSPGPTVHHGTSNQSGTRSGIADDDIDPTVFALATTLPMSCFPIDNVQQNAHSGPIADKPNPTRSNTPHGSTSRHDIISMPSYFPNLCPGSDWVDYVGRFNLIPPMSASTVSSDWPSNWSSSEPSTDRGMSRTFGAMPQSSGVARLASADGYPNTPCDSDLLAYSIGTEEQYQLEFAWNDLIACDFGSDISQSFARNYESQLPYNVFTPGLSIDSCGSHSFKVPRAFQEPCLPTAAVSPTSTILSQQPAPPFSTNQMTPPYSPNHIDKDVDDFLNELGSTINWDDVVAPGFEGPGTNAMGITSSPYVNGGGEATMPGCAQHYSPEYEQHVDTLSQDDWEREFVGGDPTGSPSVSELLGEPNYDLRSLSSLDLDL